MTNDPAILLRVDALRTRFRQAGGDCVAVDEVSFTLARGQSLAIVGESGSGKSTLAHSIARMLPPGGYIDAGAIELNGQDLLACSNRDMRRLRGGSMGICLQDAALNPVIACGHQLVEAIRRHRPAATRQAAMDLLADVGLADAATWYDTYPHQLSGGMRRRILLAMALAGYPQLLIADEPTAGLDVAVQDKVVALLADLREKRQLGVLLITHDLALAAKAADSVAVMVGGVIVELADTTDLLTRPRHPYTRGLLGCIPDPANPRERLAAIPAAGSSVAPSAGCVFQPRCTASQDERCRTRRPGLWEVSPDHGCACWQCSNMQGGED